jgi:hypothetical protein
MLSGLFEAHLAMLPRLRAEALMDAAEATAAATYSPEGWWERMAAIAKGAAAQLARRAGPLFTWNGKAVNTSSGLRRAFAQGVSGGRVES